MANLQTRGKQKVEKLSGFKDGRRRQTTRKAASATFRERVPRSASYAETHSRMCAANTLPRCPRFPRVLPRTGGSHCAQEGPSAHRRAPPLGSFVMLRDLKTEHVGEASGHHKAPGTTEELLQEQVLTAHCKLRDEAVTSNF
ncbi:uncharacterized protein LOC123330880 [Bubalus bubalis]|uniref:uncharacterized protein LOC123330880 n=1 Tax=Bubalus bubalis TaxID=89462 RepID=UPI001E1B6B28|nr:uncharacterized protein LOC123330880 [Bubalus bubalis]